MPSIPAPNNTSFGICLKPSFNDSRNGFEVSGLGINGSPVVIDGKNGNGVSIVGASVCVGGAYVTTTGKLVPGV